MEKLLRQCYKEKKIVMPSSIVFQNRITSIDQILKNEILDESEWKILTNWILGKENIKVEDILIKLEKNFCQEDVNFTIEKNEKELQILVGILIYKYSQNEENYLLPMMVICGYHTEKDVISNGLYQLFIQYINSTRLSIRHPNFLERSNYSLGIKQLKKSITEKKKKFEEEGANFSYGAAEINTMISLLEKYENNFEYIMQKEKYLLEKLKAQEEETDIVWWLLNEWSQSYNCSFSKLKIEERVLAASIELYRLNQYILGPYAIRSVIYRAISREKKHTSNIFLENFINIVKNKVLELIDIEKIDPEQVQPILIALKCIYECKESTDEQAWKTLFEGRSKRKVADFKMSAEEFAYQLYLELELAHLQELRRMNNGRK